MPTSAARTVENALEVEKGSIGGFDAMLDDPSFEFEITDILVSEKSGIRYGLSKLKDGFRGNTEITIKTWRQSGIGVGGSSELPPDISRLDDGQWKTEVNRDDCEFTLHLESADESEVEEVVNNLLSFIESEFGDAILDWDS